MSSNHPLHGSQKSFQLSGKEESAANSSSSSIEALKTKLHALELAITGIENRYAKQLQTYQSIPDAVFEAQGIRSEDRELCHREFSGAPTFFRRPPGIDPAVEASRLRDVADRVRTYIVQRRERDAANGLHNAEGLLHEYTLHLTDIGIALSSLSRAAEQHDHLERFRVLGQTFSKQKTIYAQLQARYRRIDTKDLEERDRNSFDLMAMNEAFDESPLKTSPIATLMRRLQATTQRTKSIVKDPQRGHEAEDLLQEGEVLTEELHETLLWLEKNVLGLEDAQRRLVRKKRWDEAILRSGGLESRLWEDVGLAEGSSAGFHGDTVAADTAARNLADVDPRQEYEDTRAFISSLPSPDLGPTFAYRARDTGRGKEKGRDEEEGRRARGVEEQEEDETRSRDEETARSGAVESQAEQQEPEGTEPQLREEPESTKAVRGEEIEQELTGEAAEQELESAHPKRSTGNKDNIAKADSNPSSEDSWYDCSSSRSRLSSDTDERSSRRSQSPPRFSLHSEQSSRRLPSPAVPGRSACGRTR